MIKGEEAWTVTKLLRKHITAMEMAAGEFHPPPQLPPTKSIQKPVYHHYQALHNHHQILKPILVENC